jgi:hypothetical protein
MPQVDFKKELEHLYRPLAKEFVVLDVPPKKLETVLRQPIRQV